MKIDNFIDNFICIDNMPKNSFIIYYPEVNECKIMQYEDPIVGFKNDGTPIRSSEISIRYRMLNS